MHEAKLGDRVRVQYARVFNDEKKDAAKSPAAKVREFTVGSRDVMPGISLGVVGMVPGEQKRFTLQPIDAYGPVKPGLIKEIPRAQFPKRLTLRVGKRLTALSTRSGRHRRVKVVEIKPKSVVVDGNHLLAGKVVELDVTLISVDASSDANRTQPQFDMGGEH
jgi:FKBP-type peptidyl-prolyl cis-trans isomerase 2